MRDEYCYIEGSVYKYPCRDHEESDEFMEIVCEIIEARRVVDEIYSMLEDDSPAPDESRLELACDMSGVDLIERGGKSGVISDKVIDEMAASLNDQLSDLMPYVEMIELVYRHNPLFKAEA